MGLVELPFFVLGAVVPLACLAAVVVPGGLMAVRRRWTRTGVAAWLGGALAVALWTLSGVLEPQAGFSGLGWAVTAALLAVVSVRATLSRAAAAR